MNNICEPINIFQSSVVAFNNCKLCVVIMATSSKCRITSVLWIFHYRFFNWNKWVVWAVVDYDICLGRGNFYQIEIIVYYVRGGYYWSERLHNSFMNHTHLMTKHLAIDETRSPSLVPSNVNVIKHLDI